MGCSFAQVMPILVELHTIAASYPYLDMLFWFFLRPLGAEQWFKRTFFLDKYL